MGYLKYDKSCKKLLELIKSVTNIDELENVFRQYSNYHKLVQNVNHILTYQSFYNLIEKSMMIALCTDDGTEIIDIDHYFSRINAKLTELYHDSDLNIDYSYKPPSID